MADSFLRLGKTRGLRRMADARGCFAMVALDQRPPIAQMLAARLGVAPAEVRFADMLAAKRVLVEVLGAHCSAMLLDPNFALPAALDVLPAHTGLMVTLEDHRFRETPGGRLSHSIDDWSVEKIKRIGADGVKVLVWYRPDAAADVRAHQQAYVREVGEDCRRHDIAFVLELLDYALPGQRPDTAAAQAERVVETVREFAKPEYRVDLFKLQSPWPGDQLPPPDGSPAHRQAQAGFDAMGALCRERGAPWVMLSAGVSPEQFLRVMRYACAAGASGFLAGRAIWAAALQAYPDLQACREVLRTQGLQTLAHLAALTQEAAQPWVPDHAGLRRMQAEGDLCRACG